MPREQARYDTPVYAWWPWSDPWNGAAMTRARAWVEAMYASEMMCAAMAGRLAEFDPKHTRNSHFKE